MFGRKPSAEPAPAAEPAATPGAGKGRPTPSRKEAEAARKQALKVPKDPKDARKAALAQPVVAEAEEDVI